MLDWPPGAVKTPAAEVVIVLDSQDSKTPHCLLVYLGEAGRCGLAQPTDSHCLPDRPLAGPTDCLTCHSKALLTEDERWWGGCHRTQTTRFQNKTAAPHEMN